MKGHFCTKRHSCTRVKIKVLKTLKKNKDKINIFQGVTSNSDSKNKKQVNTNKKY